MPEQHVLTADHAPREVRGVTRYPGGLQMPGAQVVILNADVDVERATVSGEDGSFTFTKLKPGRYQLSARINGFEPSRTSEVEVIPGASVNSSISLGQRRSTFTPSRGSSGYLPISEGYRAEARSIAT